MFRALLVGLGIATVATGAAAQSTGFAFCDDYLKKLQTCIDTKVPAGRRAVLQQRAGEQRGLFTTLAKDASQKPLVEKLCKQQLDVDKAEFEKAYGCAF